MAAACRAPMCSSSAYLPASTADSPSLILRSKESVASSMVVFKLLSKSRYILRASIAYTPMLNRIKTSANTPMYQSVKCVRIESNILAFTERGEGIPFPTTCLKQFHFVPVIDLSAQSLNINFDEIGKDVKVFIPNMLGNLGAAQNPVCVTCQVLE